MNNFTKIFVDGWKIIRRMARTASVIRKVFGTGITELLISKRINSRRSNNLRAKINLKNGKECEGSKMYFWQKSQSYVTSKSINFYEYYIRDKWKIIWRLEENVSMVELHKLLYFTFFKKINGITSKEARKKQKVFEYKMIQ